MWRERFESLVEELRQHSDINLRKAVLGEPATEQQLEDAEKEFGAPLPSEIREFYAELNGVRILWWHHDEEWVDKGAVGEIGIVDVASFCGPPLDWGQHRELDRSTPEYYAGVHIDDPTKILWLYEPSDSGGHLTSSFRTYLDAALETRGWCHWPSMFVFDQERAKRTGATVDEAVGYMQAIVPALFGPVDWSKVGTAGDCPAADISSLTDKTR